MKTYYSHGKLLITGEYLILDGAMALAIPTKKGQYLEVSEGGNNTLQWISKTEKGNIWFSFEFSIVTLEPLIRIENSEKEQIAKTLSKILKVAQQLNPNFLKNSTGVSVETKLEFPRNWGLGSSSTLIHNIAQWATVNAFELLEQSFGGSGYDIAAASQETPIIYQRITPQPKVQPVSFYPSFADRLYFIYLNQKKDSKDAIKHYRSLSKSKLAAHIEHINQLTEKIVAVKNIEDFEKTLDDHERLLSEILKTPTVKSNLFPDYSYSIKSLGGWGGDFVMATTRDKGDLDYFVKNGYKTIISYQEMVL